MYDKVEKYHVIKVKDMYLHHSNTSEIAFTGERGKAELFPIYGDEEKIGHRALRKLDSLYQMGFEPKLVRMLVVTEIKETDLNISDMDIKELMRKEEEGWIVIDSNITPNGITTTGSIVAKNIESSDKVE